MNEFLDSQPLVSPWDQQPAEQQSNSAFLFFFDKVKEVKEQRAQAAAARQQAARGYTEAAQRGNAKAAFLQQAQEEMQKFQAKSAADFEAQFGEAHPGFGNPVGTPSGPSEVKKPTPPRPDKFSGQKKDALLLRDWIFQMESFFHLTAETQPVISAGLNLSGPAATWWTNEGRFVPGILSSWDEFKKQLQQKFTLSAASQQARQTFSNIT